MESRELPFFADATIVGDYRPLRKYWEIVRGDPTKLEQAFLNKEDFDFLRKLVEESAGIDIASLLSALINRFASRVDCKAALQAYREVYGVKISEEGACREIARMLAGWLIEAGKNTGLLKYKFSWRGEQ